jgi:UDPglucose 6-dehydrogenase
MSATPIRLGVVGTGYVGLTTGACFAHLGHRVVCGDIDERKIESLRGGRIPIVEEGLEAIVREASDAGRLEFVVGSQAAAAGADVVFLCVPTPDADDGSADLSYVEQAAAEIGPILKPGAIVVNKSTVPVGSTIVVENVIQRDDVYVVSNPEFLREGTAVTDFLHPDRVVIGTA